MSRDSSAADCEHFVAVLDNNFLPIGPCLHGSLVEQARPCNLRTLSLPHVTLMPLAELEDDRLLAVKPTRKVNEYCWTLKPFAMQRALYQIYASLPVARLEQS